MVDLSPESSAELELEDFFFSGLLGDDTWRFAVGEGGDVGDEFFCRFVEEVAALSVVVATVAACWAAAAAATTQQGKAGRQQLGCEHILAPFCCCTVTFKRTWQKT